MIVKKVIKPIAKIGVARVDVPELEAKIEANRQAIENIKSLDNLIAGENIVLTPQSGTKNVGIDTKRDLKVNSLIASGVQIDFNSQVDFKQNAYFDKFIKIKSNTPNVESSISMLLNDLKYENNVGKHLFTDNEGVINLRTLKNNQDRIISDLGDAIVFRNKGNWNVNTRYVRYDVVVYNGKSYWLDKDASVGEIPDTTHPFWVIFAPTTTESYSKAEIDSKFQTTNQNITTNTNNIILNEGRIDGLETDTQELESQISTLRRDLGDLGNVVSANTNAINKINEKTFQYGENVVQGEKLNGKQVFIYRLNPTQDINLPNSGGAFVFGGVDEIITQEIKVANPFGDSATSSAWIDLPCVDRNDIRKQLNVILTTSNEYRILNYGITGNRRFRGYVKYTKLG